MFSYKLFDFFSILIMIHTLFLCVYVCCVHVALLYVCVPIYVEVRGQIHGPPYHSTLTY